MGGDNPFANQAIADLNNKTETEIEWQVLQPGKVDEVSKALDLKQGDQSVVVRYQFFKYLGTFDDEGLVDPTVAETPHGDVLTAAVGNYVGEQIAGFNPQAIAPIPEPATYATLLAGLGILGLAQRRRRS
ncbi:MAG: PEP-CTERM sorting domain-containing protein [Betaproteobacteria bacterium]|nr:PEP-CTERM sorting domain-containing protein [Betaproteobacteria bacterium]